MLNVCAKFHENQTCAFHNERNQRTNEPTNQPTNQPTIQQTRPFTVHPKVYCPARYYMTISRKYKLI